MTTAATPRLLLAALLAIAAAPAARAYPAIFGFQISGAATAGNKQLGTQTVLGDFEVNTDANGNYTGPATAIHITSSPAFVVKSSQGVSANTFDPTQNQVAIVIHTSIGYNTYNSVIVANGQLTVAAISLVLPLASSTPGLGYAYFKLSTQPTPATPRTKCSSATP